MITNGSSPISIPGVSKSLLPGVKKMKNNTCLSILYNFYKIREKRSWIVAVCSRIVVVCGHSVVG